jgi:hypothetical protein
LSSVCAGSKSVRFRNRENGRRGYLDFIATMLRDVYSAFGAAFASGRA